MKLITGANRGIGAALLSQIPGAQGTSRRPRTAEFLPLDVTNPASTANLALRLAGQPIELLVCNAGSYADKGVALGELTADQWAENLATNVTGVFLTVQALLPNLRAGRGKVAIIASQMGSSARAKGTSIAYRTSKAAAVNLGLNLATALHEEGIPVGIYHPGWVRTEMGGSEADIDVEDAARGLAARFEALSLATTGCFETYDGTAIPV